MPDPIARAQLPIDALLPEIAAHLASSPCLVIEAPPGAGKTTRVPPLLTGLFPDGDVVVLEPRRLAAHLSASRVAEERGEALGQTVGVQMRFESVVGPSTRLRFVTEGVLLRQLFAEPRLPRVRAVVLDEFHERHLHADLVLALLRRCQKIARPDLRIVVMSATLAGAQIAAFLGEPGAPCPIARSEGRSFPVGITHAALPSADPLAKQVRAALRELIRAESADPRAGAAGGDVLVFLPGSAEIRRCQEELAELSEPLGLDVLPLHGDLPFPDQRKAVAARSAGARRKVILSTNVAETSVTIDGVTAVIDSGLVRIASHQPWSGLPVLRVLPICRASAAQRAGRAGRTRPGTCVRLYTRPDHDLRPEFELPEIRRLDLAEMLLGLRAAGVRLDELSFLDPPSAGAIEAAELLLVRLGALDPALPDRRDWAVTPLGRRMAELPLHPRLARLLLAGQERGVAAQAATAVALLGERDIRLGQRGQGLLDPSGPARNDAASEPSDLLHLLERIERARSLRGGRGALQREGLDPDAVSTVERVSQQLLRLLGRPRPGDAPAPRDEASRDQALMKSILLGYPDRVARRRSTDRSRHDAPELVLAGGGSAVLAPSSVAREVDLAVLVDVEERGTIAGRALNRPLARMASAIEADWLLELPPTPSGDAVRESIEVSWNAAAKRVEVVRRLLFEQLVLDESRSPSDGRDAQAVALLAQQAEAANFAPFRDGEELPRLCARLALLQAVCPELGLAPPAPEPLRAAVLAACLGQGSFADLEHVSLIDEVCRQLGNPGLIAQLARLLPEHVVLPRGRRARVHYVEGQAPWIESRLQDFFGMTEGPHIAGGRVALVLHLLAPNQRAVQVTTDLRGFWTRHYPSIRKELMRRYPRHAWPEDPLSTASERV